MATIDGSSLGADPASDPGEAYRVLLARVGRKSPSIPADALVRHILGSVPAEEWPARLEAMDALLRRLESARSDGLKVESRPEDGRILGTYVTTRRDAGTRPYATLLRSVDPIVSRCDCPDYLKNSLALCKHGLVILEHIFPRPRLLRRAIKEQDGAESRGLEWDPIRPLTGPGDWLDRVSWQRPPSGEGRRDGRRAQILGRFARGAGDGLVLRQSYRDDPPKRLALVEDLLRVVAAEARARRHDPALRALLVGERVRLKRLAKRAIAPAEVVEALGGLKRPLYPYQREGVERFLAVGRLLLADDMGLGKTAQAIASCDILHRTRRVRRGLIIAPASLKPQWAREWATFSDLPIRVVEGSPAEREALYASHRSGLFIINYEQLIRDQRTIRAWDPDLVVLDEAQRIKNWATKTAMAVKELDPPYRLVLTGTPMENRIEELASVVEWVDDMALEPKWRLGPLHAVRSDGRNEVVGVRHLDTIRQRLDGCMLRRIRQDVLSQLPPRTDVRVPVELTESQREEHDALIQPIASIVQRSKTRALTQPEFLRLMSLLTTQRIISNGLAQLQFEDVWPSIRTRPPEESLIRSLSAPKLLELRQLIRQVVIEQGRKVVVFSQWRRMLMLSHWAVADLLRENSLRAGFFTGAEGSKRRTQNIVEFHDDPSFRILFASDAGGVGLNLQHAADSAINLEMPWNPAVLEQRIGRIYRIGQSRPIDVFNLVSEEGIESRIAGLVGSKQAFFKGLFDGDSDAIRFEETGSFLNRVEKLYGDSTPSPGGSPSAADALGPATLDDLDSIPEDDAPDPFAQVLDAADESDDATPAAPSTDGEPDHRPGPTPDPADVRSLFGRLRVHRRDDGGVIIEAPPEAATALSALFEGMAALLQSIATSPGGATPVDDGRPPPEA